MLLGFLESYNAYGIAFPASYNLVTIKPEEYPPVLFLLKGGYIMATTRIMPLHTGIGRNFGSAISDIIDYVANPEKTDNGNLISCFACDSRCADSEFTLSKREYLRKTGRARGKDDVIAYHLRQAFRPGEITPEEANRLGVEFAKRFTKGNHAFVVCTHIDKAHIHNHIIWNAVNIECDHKFRNFWGSTRAVRLLSDTLCIENGYSIVANPKRHGKAYNKWLGENAPLSHRETLRLLIDKALETKPANLDLLLEELQRNGCDVSYRGKSINIKYRGWKKHVRLDSLGDGYQKDDLMAILLGKKDHTPRKKKVSTEPQKSTKLLIDIQAALQNGKGAGYQNWAKKFNLKQMAQTINYLSEKGLLDRSDLESAVANASTRYHELSTEIKNAETRMAEISVLRTHIINYARTRDTYLAYRKSGYSKSFLAEHEKDILLHKAAKAAFNERNLKKLPSVKNLQIEYASLMASKKNAYAEYRIAREEMKRLQIAKANLDAILNDNENKQQNIEKGKEKEVDTQL